MKYGFMISLFMDLFRIGDWPIKKGSRFGLPFLMQGYD